MATQPVAPTPRVPPARPSGGLEPKADQFEFIVVSNRLPVEPDPVGGGMVWRSSPGGLVSAVQPVIAKSGGAWIGWTGEAAPESVPGHAGQSGLSLSPRLRGRWEDTGEVQVVKGDPGQARGSLALGHPGGERDAYADESQGVHAVPVPLSEDEVASYYEGFCNATIWPLYHDVIAPPVYSRRWWHSYAEVNQRFAAAVAAHASEGATVWAHDYHLQLVPAMLRGLRPDLRIGFFNHIPFPPVDLFAQLPWRREVIEGLLGADLIGFQTADGAANFLRACRRFTEHHTQGPMVSVARRAGGDPRLVRVGAFPISVDALELSELARRPETIARAAQIRHDLGDPDVLLLGVDRLDYTKGLLHRLRAYGELLKEGRLSPPSAVFVQVASPSRGEVEQYQKLREEVERTVGSINGDFSPVGHPAVHYLHQSFPKEEMAAMYLAADVALVTPLRDGMNLVAKEYVACRYDMGGRLVLSELTGAAEELKGAFLVNPHDIDSLKAQIMAAVEASDAQASRRMRRLRQRVFANDVHRWAAEFLSALGVDRPGVAGDIATHGDPLVAGMAAAG
ncbi:MAG TPA: trehalose-6-phosphate synthase [Acidimicrobiales bacterium]|nr:trehalose-6-phosphate synthase [Acidimicrobiales bacterium]